MVRLYKLSIEEQVQLTAEASIFISVCGGGAVTAMFLPKGASLLLYFNENPSVIRRHDTPARLDWDLLNNIGYIRVHLLSRPKSKFSDAEPADHQSQVDLEAFVRLVDHELDIISHTSEPVYDEGIR